MVKPRSTIFVAYEGQMPITSHAALESAQKSPPTRHLVRRMIWECDLSQHGTVSCHHIVLALALVADKPCRHTILNNSKDIIDFFVTYRQTGGLL